LTHHRKISEALLEESAHSQLQIPMKTKNLIAAAALAAAVSTVAQAQFFNTVTGTLPTLGSEVRTGTHGHYFEVSSPVYVTGLFAFDAFADGLDTGITVSIYAAGAGSPVVSQTIMDPASTGLYVAGAALPPFTYVLNPGSYALTAHGFTVADPLGDGAGPSGPVFTSDPAITYQWDITNPTTGINPLPATPPFPSLAVNQLRIANFSFTPVPEPETYAMAAGLGLVGFGLWRRRSAK
jgi:hypothetical protein